MSARLAGRIAAALAAVAAALAPACAPAGADVFEAISLVSDGSLASGPLQQAEYAHDTAISADGRYVAFDGSIGGVTGVWRRDLQTGALQQVAGGDAELPSLSADGRYVSFTTNEGASLPEITYGLSGAAPSASAGAREAVNVYVRDMSLAPRADGAFVLASAADGPGEPVKPLLYQSSEPTKFGASAIGRSAISADGQEVAFVTTAISNLAGPSTPALQVAVRYLNTHETRLVSRCYVACRPEYQPAVGSTEAERPYGAVYPGAAASFRSPPPYGAYGVSPPPGASISADGSTVAWIGEDVGQQAPLLGGEARSAHYTEPLWRRIAPPETATERVTGGSDPANPACAASGERSLPGTPSLADPCQGPFVLEEQVATAGVINQTGGETGDFVPRLSADGYTVAFVSQAPLVSLGEDFGRGTAGQQSDLYVATMRPGSTRVQALQALTELAGGEGVGPAQTAPIFDFEISPDGRQIAFCTRRIEFPLGSPAYVSAPAGEAGMNELFDVDLADDTLTRVTHGYASAAEAGQHAHAPTSAGVDPYLDPGDGALSPSFSGDGSVLAFSSTASNLVYGDGNAPPASSGSGVLDGSDAFTVARRLFAPLPTPQSISPPPGVATQPVWTLGVSAVSRPDGSVLLYVRAPGAGRLWVSVRAQVQAGAGRASDRRGHGARGGGRGARSAARRAPASSAVATRVVASATRNVPDGEGPATLLLRLARPYGALASRRGGLPATLAVAFSALGEPTLRESLEVAFARTAHAARRRGHGARATHGKRR